MTYEWQAKTPAEKAAYGFVDTKNLTVRAKTCMDCHVGGDRADVNHDLYAAGHPPLNWEYSSDLERYLPYQHWSAAADRQRYPAYEAQAWVIGQAVSARASLYLLDALARKAANHSEHTPWPEFAAYGCASCHHTFNPRQPHNAESVHKAGSPTYSPFVDLTRLLPDHPPLTNIEELRKTMESQSPDPHKVEQLSKSLMRGYDEWLKRPRPEISYSPDALRQRLAELAGPNGQEVAKGGWDDARQLTDRFRLLPVAERGGT